MPDIKQITLPSVGGQAPNTYYLRDSRVDTLISQVTRWVGVTTTPLSDGSTASVIVINNVEHTAVNGDIASYNNMEFIYNSETANPAIWQEFGSTGALKALAFKDSVAVSTVVPATFSTNLTMTAGGTDTVTGVTNAGSMPTFTVSNEVLTITAGSVPTLDTQKTFKTEDTGYTASTTIASTANVAGSVSYTP